MYGNLHFTRNDTALIDGCNQVIETVVVDRVFHIFI
jgi:hypothetical protein